MVALRLAALAVAIPAVAAIGLEMLADPCEGLSGHILEPYGNHRFYLNKAVPFKFCSDNPHSKFIDISFTTRDERGASHAPPNEFPIAQNVHTPGVFLENRYYEKTIRLKKGAVPRGEYWLKVVETYSPNDDGKTQKQTYTIPIAVMN